MKRNNISCCLMMLAALMLSVTKNLPKQEEYIRSRVIELKGNGALCSGIQVHSPKGGDYILSAAHCSELAKDGIIYASSDEHRFIPRHVVEIQSDTDLMLLEGMPDMKGIAIADAAPMHRVYQAYTHGNGQSTHRADGEYLEEKQIEVLKDIVMNDEEQKKCEAEPKQRVADGIYCVHEYTMVVTTIHVEPGSSGGPVVNNKDELTGIVSSANSYFSNMVPLHYIQAFLSAY